MRKSVHQALMAVAAANPAGTYPGYQCAQFYRQTFWSEETVDTSGDDSLQACYDAAKTVIESDYPTVDVCVEHNADSTTCSLFYIDYTFPYNDPRYEQAVKDAEDNDGGFPDTFSSQAEYDTYIAGLHAWLWIEGTQITTEISYTWTGPDPDVMHAGTMCDQGESPSLDTMLIFSPVDYSVGACFAEAHFYMEHEYTSDDGDICVNLLTSENSDETVCMGVKRPDEGDQR